MHLYIWKMVKWEAKKLEKCIWKKKQCHCVVWPEVHEMAPEKNMLNQEQKSWDCSIISQMGRSTQVILINMVVLHKPKSEGISFIMFIAFNSFVFVLNIWQ